MAHVFTIGFIQNVWSCIVENAVWNGPVHFCTGRARTRVLKVVNKKEEAGDEGKMLASKWEDASESRGERRGWQGFGVYVCAYAQIPSRAHARTHAHTDAHARACRCSRARICPRRHKHTGSRRHTAQTHAHTGIYSPWGELAGTRCAQTDGPRHVSSTANGTINRASPTRMVSLLPVTRDQ